MKAILQDTALPYARQLWRYKWLSVAVAWVICAVGWPIVAMIPPRYESSARVYLNADPLLTPLLRGLAVDDNPVRHVEYLQRTLLSRPNLEQVIRLSDLDVATRANRSEKEMEELLRRLAIDVTIRPQTVNLISLTYRNSDPVVAKNVVQALLTVFSENSTGSNRKEMENAKRFIGQQIQTYEAQLRAAEKRRAEFHEKYMDLLPGIDGAASRLESGRNLIAKTKLDVADVRAKRDSLHRELESVPKTLSMDAAGAQVIIAGQQTGYRARLEAARAKLEELRLRFTEQHPDVIALRRQIAELEGQAAREASASSGTADAGGGRKTQVANPVYEQVKIRLVEAETALVSAERRLKQAEDDQTVLEDRAHATPGTHAQAQDLDRDYAVKKRNFDELLQRREQTGIAEAADTTADKIQFRIIDPPQIPVVAAAPNQPMLLSGVFIAALGAAIGLPLLLMQLDKSYVTVTALRGLGLPVLGSVSWLVSPGAQRSNRMQTAGVCASVCALLSVYGLLLLLSLNIYRLGII